MTNLLAVAGGDNAGGGEGIPLSPKGGFFGIGPLGKPGGSGVEIFTKFLSSTIGLLTIIAFIWFAFVFITGAIGIISSGGDKAALESAQKRITNGLIGMVVVIAAIFVISLIGTLLGIPNILNIPELFNALKLT